MANVFKTARVIVQEMCDDFKSITTIVLTPDMYDDPRVVKFWTDAGAISALTSTIQRVVDDQFAATSSVEGLVKHLAARSMPTLIQPQKSIGVIQLSGDSGATINDGNVVQAKRVSDGALFNSISGGVADGAGKLNLYFQSVLTGNAQNLDSLEQPFVLVASVPGFEANCINVTKFLDGRDIESRDEAAARVIAHDQDDDSGGNEVAYKAWAKGASSEVVSSTVVRHARGPDTVDLIITSGTTDIEGAVETGQSVTRLPSADLIVKVLNYVNQMNPITDDVIVYGPEEVSFDVAIHYSLYDESPANRAYVDSILSKVAKTFIYSAKSKDVLSPTDLERAIDKRVGDMIRERVVGNFDGATSKITVPIGQIFIPGTITIGTYP